MAGDIDWGCQWQVPEMEKSADMETWENLESRIAIAAKFTNHMWENNSTSSKQPLKTTNKSVPGLCSWHDFISMV